MGYVLIFLFSVCVVLLLWAALQSLCIGEDVLLAEPDTEEVLEDRAELVAIIAEEIILHDVDCTARKAYEIAEEAMREIDTYWCKK